MFEAWSRFWALVVVGLTGVEDTAHVVGIAARSARAEAEGMESILAISRSARIATKTAEAEAVVAALASTKSKTK